MSAVAQKMVAGDANARIVTLDAGDLLALEKNEHGWSAVCLMQPSLATSLLSKPCDQETLAAFYDSVRPLGERQLKAYPFVAWDHCPEQPGRDNGPILQVNSHPPLALGAWGAVSRAASRRDGETRELSESPSLALLNVALGMVAVGSAYLAPMYLVGHCYNQALTLGTSCAFACAALYFTWYRTLPRPNVLTAEDQKLHR